MPSSLDFKDQLKQQADIVRVVGEYIKLRKSGAQNYSGICPFHKEKSPSFSVHATKQFYHCFGCGDSGDVFKFIQKIENVTFPEAVRVVAHKLGVPMPKMQFDSPAEQREAMLRTRILEMHERACVWFQEQLKRPEGANAREYLAGRGLNEEIIRAFRIGFAPESGFLLRDRLRGEYDEEMLRQSGLFSWKQEDNRAARRPDAAGQPANVEPTNTESPIYSKFRNRIMFPIMNEAGRVIAFTGRTLSADEKAGPKYLNSPETPIYTKSRVLFNLDKAKEAMRALQYAILVEGQMDCIALYSAGFHNVIASSGTAFTEIQAKLLGRHTNKIVVNFDPDAAGAAAAERSLALLVEEDFEIKVMTLEPGLDPDLFIREKGKEAYTEKLRRAPRYFDYLIERAQTRFPVRTPEGKVKALNFLLPHIQKVPSRIARDEIANEISQKLGIDSAVLRTELRHAATNRGTKQIHATVAPALNDSERILIRALASQEILGSSEGRISQRDGAEEEFDPCRQARFILQSESLLTSLRGERLISMLVESESADPMSLELTDADRRLLAECLLGEEEELTRELLEGAFEALRRRKLERDQREIRLRIAEAERKNDASALTLLLKEKFEIDRALKAVASIAGPAA